MRKISATHTVNCDVDTYWEIFLDVEFTKELHTQDLGTRELEVLEKTDTTRRLRVVPKLTLPKPLQKLLGDSFTYVEQGSLDRDAQKWSWTITPSSMSEKIKTSGSFRLEPVDGGKCKRIDECSVEAKVFGVGKLMESTTEKQCLETFDKEVEAVNRWVAKRG